MAQIKRRKVSGKATKNVKRERKPLHKNKKFWISLFTLIILTFGIVLTVVLVKHFKNSSSSDEDEILAYFDGESDALNNKVNKDLVDEAKATPGMTYEDGYKPEFKKISLDGIKMHTKDSDDDSYIEYMFIFACDLTKYYPCESDYNDVFYDEDDDDTKKWDETSEYESHYKVFKQLTYLQYRIDKENERLEEEAKANNDKVAYKIRLYIVDSSKSNNLTIYTDSIFGGIGNESSSVMFGLLNLVNNSSQTSKLDKKYQKDGDIYAVNDYAKIGTTAIENSLKYMDNSFKKD